MIIGPDLVYRDGRVLVNPSARAQTDQSIKGWKRALESDPDETRKKVSSIIRNTYRTLMARGMKGCWVYACDAELGEYIRARVAVKTE